MRRIINVLGAIVLLLLLVLRRSFASAIRELFNPTGERRRDRDLLVLIGVAAVVFPVFFVLAIWALVDAGYWIVAILLTAHVAILLDGARRRVEE